MLRNLNVTSGGRRILGVPDVGVLAATIASQTASGTNGPGLLYDESINPANSGKQLRISITSAPGSGTLFVYENGAFDFDGAADGTYSIGYDWYADDVLGGSDTATVVVGAADGSAAGATLTGASSLSSGSASGTAAGSAAGVTLTGVSSLTPGSVSGTGEGSAAGIVLTGASSLGSGTASGTEDGVAAGVDLVGASTLSPGVAQGNSSGSAPGAALSGSSSISTGLATGTSILSDGDIARIAVAVWAYAVRELSASGNSAAADATISAATLTPIHANVQQMNDANLIGNGTAGNKWRGA